MSNDSKSVVENQYGEVSIGTTLPIGGSSGPIYITPNGKNVYTGTGVPTQTAPEGSFYIRGDGSSVDQFLYINTDGMTSWTAASLSGGGGGSAVPINLVFVSQKGSDSTGDGTLTTPFFSYAHAAASISDASAINPYAIVVTAGKYSETNFRLFPFISIIGAGSSATLFQASGSGNLTLDSTWSGKNSSVSVSGIQLVSTGIDLDSTAFPATITLELKDIITSSTVTIFTGASSPFVVTTRLCYFSNQMYLDSCAYFDYGGSHYSSITNISSTHRGTSFYTVGTVVQQIAATSTGNELDISCYASTPIAAISASGSLLTVSLDATTYVSPTLSGGATLSLQTVSDGVLANYSPSNYSPINTAVQGHLHGIDNALASLGGSSVSFAVHQNIQQTIPNNVITKMNWDTVDYDTGGYFNTSTSIYNPKVAGKYIFILQPAWSIPGASANVQSYIFKNTSTPIANNLLTVIGNGSTTNIPLLVVICDMNGTTDSVNTSSFISGNSGSGLNLANSVPNLYFSGALLDQKASSVTPSILGRTIYYSVSGSDVDGDGTIDFPLASPGAALTLALTLTPTFNDPIIIQGDPGRYNITTAAMIYPNIYYTGVGVVWNGSGASSITLAPNSAWSGSSALAFIKDIQLNGSLSLNLDSTSITSFDLTLTIGDQFTTQKGCTFKKGNAGHIFQLYIEDAVTLDVGGNGVTIDGVDTYASGPHKISSGGSLNILTTTSGCSFVSVGNVAISDVTITTSSTHTVSFSAFAGQPVIVFAIANVNNSIEIFRDSTTFSSNTGYAGSFPASVIDQNVSQLNSQNPNSLNYAATIAWDTRSIPSASVILTGGALIGNPTGLIDGGVYYLDIIQDATGGRAVTWDTNFQFPMGTPTLNSTANANNPFLFYSPDSSLMICMSPAASGSSSTILKTIYVSKLGSDSTGTGTIATPFLTIAHAMAYIVANFTPSTSAPFTISIDNGTYSETGLTLRPNINLVGSGKKSTFISNSADITLNAAWEGTTTANCDIKDLQIAGAHTLNIDTTGRTTVGGFINLDGVIVVNPPTFKQSSAAHNLLITLVGDVYLDLTEDVTTIDSINFTAYGPFQISSGGTTDITSTVTGVNFTAFGDLGNTNYVLTSVSTNQIAFVNLAGNAVDVAASGTAAIAVTRDATTWTPGLGNSTNVSDSDISQFYRTSPQALSDTSTITWDLSQYPSVSMNTAAARTIAFSGLGSNNVGQLFFCFFTSGGFNSTWNSNFIFPNGQPDTTRSATYLLVFQAISSTQIQLVNSFSQWVDVTGVSITMVAGNIYYANNASQGTFTIPATINQNDFFEVIGKGAGGWKIAQSSGQSIPWTASLSTTTGVSGSLQSTDRYDVIRLRAISSTQLVPSFVKGNITVT